ncbi:MAG: (Fe-S)-binding protein [Anaerolineales bacterium]|jgi:L-lactate dehydrogenase complex protein LldE
MEITTRESPQGKRVSLFVTCMVDMLYPETGWSVVAILEHLGVEVDFPPEQTCCGQPAFNAGHWPEARDVAIQFLKAFKDAEVIVAPSGSCAAMVRQEYPVLFAEDETWREAALHAASITWEFSEFLVDGLGVTDLHLELPEKQTFAFHDSCHGLRMLGLETAARELLGHTKNAEVDELAENDVCCGFGGLFSVKMADVSGAMLARKISQIQACRADTIVCGDVSCLTHMNGGLERTPSSKRVRHIADVLADGLREKDS